MSEFHMLNLIIALVALILSLLAFWQSCRRRVADSFAKLYDELNTPSFGADMERIGEWIADVAAKVEQKPSALTEAEVRRSYRDHLEWVRSADKNKNTKKDLIEGARRSVKAWFVKCLLYHKAKDLSPKLLSELISADRARLMLYVIAMSREQTDFWKRCSHNPDSRRSSDEAHFRSLEELAAQKDVRLLQPHNPTMHSTGSSNG